MTGSPMRIAMLNVHRHMLGGGERYLATVCADLAAAGHEVALLYEQEVEGDRAPIALPPETPVWRVGGESHAASLAALRDWGADLFVAHGTADARAETSLLDTLPGVFVAHSYQGTCISGHKMHASPVPTPCARRFGAGCLRHYYPRRCGGLNPLTMLTSYRRQAGRLERLERYGAIVTLSSHMRREYLNHGFAPEKVVRVPAPVLDRAPRRPPDAGPEAPSRIAFVGRLDELKGVEYLIDAMPLAATALSRPLELAIVGAGPREAALRRRAAARADARVAISFAGWMDAAQMSALYARTDLLVMPSIWPEPFGLAGAEAGGHGVPAVAFAVGGIPDWLDDGVGGILAHAEPPDPAALARAMVEALRDPARHARLREGALASAARFTRAAHLDALLDVLGRHRRAAVEAPAG